MQDELVKLKSENEKLRQRLSAKDEMAVEVKAQTVHAVAEIEVSQGFVVRSAGRGRPVSKPVSESDESSSSGSYSTDSDDLFDDSVRKTKRAQNKQFKNNKNRKSRGKRVSGQTARPRKLT